MRKDSEGVDLAILEDLGEHAESYLRSKYPQEVAEEILSRIENALSERNEIPGKRLKIRPRVRHSGNDEENA